MSYRDFSLQEIERRFGLAIVESPDLFADVDEAAPSARLVETLEVNVPLALDVNTEKARSEFVIAPVLLEVHALLDRRISLFSGVSFDVAPEQGLNGVCDFLLSGSSQQLFVKVPIVAVTEAKNEDFKAGFAQCLATMLAARLFNEREGQPGLPIFGAVTTGSLWRFLRLGTRSAEVDKREYHLPEGLAKVLGIFVGMFHTGADADPADPNSKGT